MACLAAKPIVNGIERDLEGTARVVRIDLLSADGRAIARRYGVRAIPALLIFDGGDVVDRRTGIPDRDEVVTLVRRLGSAPASTS